MILKNYIEQRAIEVAEYMIKEHTTVRDVAKRFGISKSTVHKDVTERLPEINLTLYEQVRKVLDINKAQRHLRGGQATKRKYEKEKN